MTDKTEAAVTLQDIANAADVSVASVSKVLNNRPGVGEESRRRIIGIADEMGYQSRASRGHSAAKSRDITIVTPGEYYSNSQFYGDVIRGVLDEAKSQGVEANVRLIARDLPEAESDIAKILGDTVTSAILLVGLDYPEIIERIVQSGFPTVIVNGTDRSMRLSSITPDNRSAGWLATCHLLDAGHRNIVHVTFPHRSSLIRRMDGFRDALEEAGVQFDPARHVLDLNKEGVRDFEAALAIKQALKAGRLADTTAFFCSTDLVALGVMEGLKESGYSVPGSYSVVGLDDVPIALYSRPPLTTIRIDRMELGRVGFAMLQERISNPSLSVRHVDLGVTLIERHTVSSLI
ncbi:LacI family DNA-binding transcriptional regulator [Phyllobacterium sp. OV277]|jgi:DNA-binding LacI/PurR family transcriptional regulator|uniref:LacI family DNA-binding transcriptional regulator n=1 Tax=Phyllobacterium sp. OV277 TaxID=1882772 RepID=UPI000885749D|nr:LacI family DNA-binding transcriptional regulator [Phyllobacterium sp. OV277]SDP85246.1 transcriptional regulator, LacI family [Phyllobacterium sp. OV277]